jgi:hypothetical protein
MLKTILPAALAMLVAGALPAAGGIATSPIAIEPPPPPPPLNVTVSRVAHYATGSMSGAHNGAWPNEQVMCQRYVIQGTPSTMCMMTDANHISASCWTSDPGMLAVLYSINADSSLTFDWNDQGTCTYVVVTEDSRAAPKAAP